jgi:hypothetical protein
VTEVKAIVGEPLQWAAEKQIYCCQQASGENSYVLIKN